MTIRTLIVDDEPLARLNLSTLLESEPDFELVGECADAPSALQAMAQRQPDLLFLDVQMPGADGFGLLAHVPVPPAVVFVTAHAEFALRAFDVDAVDYLLKPFRRERFAQALDRVRAHLNTATPAEASPDRLLVRSGGRLLFVPTDEIDYARAAANYVSLHAGAANHVVRITMTELAQRLPAARFQRIHRSYIVALQALEAIEPAGGGEYVARLRSGRELPVGASFLAALRSRLADAAWLRVGTPVR